MSETPKRFTPEAEAQGCLCFAEKTNGGFYEHHPDACPLHGWNSHPTPERLAQCRHEKDPHQEDTDKYIKLRTVKHGEQPMSPKPPKSEIEPKQRWESLVGIGVVVQVMGVIENHVVYRRGGRAAQVLPIHDFKRGYKRIQ